MNRCSLMSSINNIIGNCLRRKYFSSSSSLWGSKTSSSIRHHFSYGHAGHFEGSSSDHDSKSSWSSRHWLERGFTVGIGGPVGSGKTALVLQLTKSLQLQQQQQQQQQEEGGEEDGGKNSNSSIQLLLRNIPPLGVVTNDIFTQEDAEFLIRHNALPSHRIRAVETGGCPHAAIREDISANLTALEQLTRQIVQEEVLLLSSSSSTTDHQDGCYCPAVPPPPPPLLFCESGGDNLAAQFSSELADFTIYVIDVAGGDKVPRKGGPGITQSDLLVINKVDLAPAVGADLNVMKRDAERMRSCISSTNNKAMIMAARPSNGGQQQQQQQQRQETMTTCGPIVFASIRHGQGVEEIKQHILRNYQLAISTPHHNDHHHHHHTH